MYERLPITFRQEIIGPLLDTLRAGESASLVGVGSSGKSNVVRHLARADVREHYLGDAAQRVLNVYVNCTKLTGDTYAAHGLYTLILEVVAKTPLSITAGAETLAIRLRDLWREAIATDVADLARSNLEDAVATVFRAGIAQVFATFDDFDSVVMGAPGPVLNSLRALRDDHKTRLMYVTVTRRELEFLRDPAEYEDFFELVVPRTMAVGPYTEADASFMIKRLAARETPVRTLSEREERRLLELSGQHAGLLKVIFGLMLNQIPLLAGDRRDVLDRLRAQPDVAEECKKIWGSLEAGERNEVKAFVTQGNSLEEVSSSLLKKGIIQIKADGSYQLFSPIFADFIADSLPETQVQIQLLPGKRVKIAERIIDDLNEVEYQLLAYLVDQHPEAVTREQMLERMLAAEARQPKTSGPPERRLEVYLTGLKRKAEVDGREYVLFLPDRRYKLWDGRR